jgi:hypothetical protein
VGKNGAPHSMEEGVPAIPADEGGMFALTDAAPVLEGLADTSMLLFPSPSMVTTPSPSPPSTQTSAANFTIPTLQRKRRAPSHQEPASAHHPVTALPPFLSQFRSVFSQAEGTGDENGQVSSGQFALSDEQQQQSVGNGESNGEAAVAHAATGSGSKVRRIDSYLGAIESRPLPSHPDEMDVLQLAGVSSQSCAGVDQWGEGEGARDHHLRADMASSGAGQGTVPSSPVAGEAASTFAPVDTLSGLPWPKVPIASSPSAAAELAGQGRVWVEESKSSTGGTDSSTGGAGAGVGVEGTSSPAAGLAVTRAEGEESGSGGGAVALLPEGWIKRFSGKRQCDYWFNTLDGTSQWFPPS